MNDTKLAGFGKAPKPDSQNNLAILGPKTRFILVKAKSYPKEVAKFC